MHQAYVNESEYHQYFIRSLSGFPSVLKASPDNHVFVWAHELGVYDAGRGGGNGSVDLATVDEEGQVWIIEAKLGGNTELNDRIWEGQLRRYRDGLRRMAWDTIHHSTCKFLQAYEQVKPLDGAIMRQAKDLVDALYAWQSLIGRTKVPAEKLRDYIAFSLEQGNTGLMVLADRLQENVVWGGKTFDHPGPLAYVIGYPEQDGMIMHTHWHRPSRMSPGERVPMSSYQQRSYAEYRHGLDRFDHSTEEMVDGLCEGAQQLWRQVLQPGLIQLGWDGKPLKQQSTNKSIWIAFSIANRKIPLLQVGWIDAGAKKTQRENKVVGNFALKLDWNNHRNKEDPWGQQAFVEKWAAQFYKLGWRGKGGGEKAGKSPLSQQEWEAWVGRTMKYSPPNVQGFTGQGYEYDVAQRFLKTLALMLDDIRANHFR